MTSGTMIERVRQAARQRLLFLPTPSVRWLDRTG